MKNLKCKVLALTMGAIVFIGGKAFAQVPSYVPTNGLVGWWPFNGNANDESGNGNNGTVNGATLTTDRFGNANKAYNFDGVDDFISSNVINLPLNNSPRSFSGYIYYQPEIGYTDWSCIMSYGTGFGTTDAGKLNDIFIGTNNHDKIYLNNNEYSSISDPLINLSNSWYHFVITYDGNNLNNIQIYINGILQSVTYTNYVGITQLITTASDLYFGRSSMLYSPFTYYYYKGSIDDIGIWNRTLNTQEISDLYNANNCSNDLAISPTFNTQNIGNNVTFTATTSDSSPTYIWQSDLGQGFQTLNNYGNYSGVNTNSLTISNVQLANHNQPIRAISTSGNCIDTSNIATIQIADTCITTVYDTLLTTVTDTLIINTTLSLPAPNNENTILIYPNPASDHITIDNGNFAAIAGYSIKIENNAGQQVFQSAINQAQFYVDLSTWTGNGLYFVHLIDPQNNTLTIRKIVLQ